MIESCLASVYIFIQQIVSTIILITIQYIRLIYDKILQYLTYDFIWLCVLTYYFDFEILPLVSYLEHA